MSDLISRDKFINSIVCSVSSPCETKQEQRDAQFKQKYTVDAFIKELRRAPAVDAVEVVRCGDCKYHVVPNMDSEGNIPYLFCFRCNNDEGDSSMVVDFTDYCSYGERRESEVGE